MGVDDAFRPTRPLGGPVLLTLLYLRWVTPSASTARTPLELDLGAPKVVEKASTVPEQHRNNVKLKLVQKSFPVGERVRASHAQAMLRATPVARAISASVSWAIS
jgi:hypothetical protein